MQRFFVLALALLAGCKNEEIDCGQRAHDLGEWIRAIPRASGLDQMGPDVVLLPESVGVSGYGVDPSTLLVVDDKKVTLWGAEATSEMIATAVSQGRVGLAPTPNATWGKVVDAVHLLEDAGAEDVTFVFRRPMPTRPPPQSKLSKRIEELWTKTDPSMRATELAKMFEETLEDCKSAKVVFGRIALVEPSAREDELRTNLAESIRECHCRCDLEAVQSLMWALLAPRIKAVTHRVRLPASTELDDPTTATIAQPAAMPWSEAHREVLSAQNRSGVYGVAFEIKN
jgi:hypothetical protein